MPSSDLQWAGAFDIARAIGLKFAEWFTLVWPSTGTVMAMLARVFSLAQALKSIPVGTGYAV
jgi:quaternary ammonium compound-resistance protein SugE